MEAKSTWSSSVRAPPEFEGVLGVGAQCLGVYVQTSRTACLCLSCVESDLRSAFKQCQDKIFVAGLFSKGFFESPVTWFCSSRFLTYWLRDRVCYHEMLPQNNPGKLSFRMTTAVFSLKSFLFLPLSFKIAFSFYWTLAPALRSPEAGCLPRPPKGAAALGTAWRAIVQTHTLRLFACGSAD